MIGAVLKYDIGPIQPDELNLVFNSWCKSYRDANADTRDTPTNLYYRGQRDVIDSILLRFPVILVARADGVALGWICGESLASGPVVHYCYVKSTYRRQGIALSLLSNLLSLLPDGAARYTHCADRWDERVRELGLEPLHVETSLKEQLA
jgi:L-amino acid N-acyltransferase YncA